VQRLILRRSGDVATNCQIAEKGAQLNRPHVAWVTLTVKEDEASDPLQIRLLGSDAVVTQADHFAYLVEQPWLGRNCVGN
jgi:hypothetical protein